MTDENATRAPESDATADTQPSTISQTDTPAQSGPSLGHACTTAQPLASSTPPRGEITSLNGIQTYITKPSSYPSEPSKLLLLLTGGTGLNSQNNQHQADLYAERGYVVVMPDQFGGDAAPNTGAVAPGEAAGASTAEGGAGLLERVKLGAAETAKSFMIDMWLARQTPEKVVPVLLKVLEAARETFADAVANGGGVYGVGYCVGAKYLLSLLAPAQDSSQTQTQPKGEDSAEKAPEPELKCGALAHGALITQGDLEGVRRPVAVVAVAGDSLFPDDVREQGKAAMELNAVEHDVRVFEGVPHGFAVVGDYEDEGIRKAQGEAFEVMCGWLDGH